LDHLHYGYWPDDLDVDITNLRRAQDEYVKFFTSQIPEGVKTILDVGCGAGRVARKLISMGYEVDCVSPGAYLTEQARKSVGEKGHIFHCKYQNMETDKRYDLIMFIESFQYISLQSALDNTVRFLKPGGHMLICDTFKKDVEGEGKQKGGHVMSNFLTRVEACPFKLIEDIDVTEQTAPTMDLLNDVLVNVGKPVTDSVIEFLADRYPTLYKLVSWKFRDDLEKVNDKYSGGSRTAEQFKKFKTYRLMLYQKNGQYPNSK
jgi:ubiquinone/menaquinone biosynthesis C-methylase UbiE